ncbi:MAG: hypothetical protein ACRED9_12005 [Caulobacteraceae bacterium]
MTSGSGMKVLAAGAALGVVLAIPALAVAGGCNCSPPPPPPPPPPCNCAPPSGPTVNIPGVNVFVAPSVIVNSQASATAQTSAQAASFINSAGGAAGGVIAPTPTGVIKNLDVVGGEERVAYQAEKTVIRKVAIQAFCFDDKMMPHPASQVIPERDIDDSYEGELYRCIAGTHMQVTIADWRPQISFAGGQTIACQKGEALYHWAGGEGHAGRIACRAQIPQRPCNERSLLRRYGAGIKVLTLVTIERYTAWREERSGGMNHSGLTLDGGVGGIQY